MASILIGFILVLSTSPAAATSQRPVVVGYLAALKGLDLSIARTDLSAFTHYHLSFANPDAEGSFFKEGRMQWMAGESGANLSLAEWQGTVPWLHTGSGKLLLRQDGRRAGKEGCRKRRSRLLPYT